MEIVLHTEGKHLVPQNYEMAGLVLPLPGSTESGFEGLATLSLIPEALVLATPLGIEAVVPLDSIEDVAIVKVDGVLIERSTSVGPILTPLPYPHGIEVSYSIETRLKLRLRLVTMSGNAAHMWAVEIRRAAQQAQLAILSEMMPRKRFSHQK